MKFWNWDIADRVVAFLSGIAAFGFFTTLTVFLIGAARVGDGWAAWIQAIGAIAAIAGSYWLGERNYRRDKRELAESQRSDLVLRLNIAMAAISLSQDRVGYIALRMEGEPPVVDDAMLVSARDCIGVLKESTAQIKDRPGLWVQMTRLTQNLGRVDEIVRAARDYGAGLSSVTCQNAIAQANQYLSAATEVTKICQADIYARHVSGDRR